MTTPTIPFYPVTHDDGTNIVEALNNLVSAKRMPYVVADGFSTSVSYNVNDYVIHENNLYRFTAPHTAGPWNSSQAIRVTIGEELNTLNIEKVNNNVIAPIFTTDNNYNINDIVLYNGNLYRFISQHTAGVWNETEVTQTNAISEGGGGTGVGDEITFDGDNMIITSSERSIESLESSIAIVANGNTHPLINQGEYVYVKMHDTLSEGLYTANSTIVETDNLTTSNLTSVSKGGLNEVLTILPITMYIPTRTDGFDCLNWSLNSHGFNIIYGNSSTQSKPEGDGGYFISLNTMDSTYDFRKLFYLNATANHIYVNTYYREAWSGWTKIIG